MKIPLALLLSALIIISAVSWVSTDVEKAGRFFVRKTQHYVVESDISAEFTEEIADEMEAIYDAYQRTFRNIPGTDPVGFRVRVFKRQDDYKKFVGRQYEKSYGIFIPHSRTLATFLEGQVKSSLIETLYHEGFHQFMTAKVGRSPVWLDEGLAVLFQHSIRRGKKLDPRGVPPDKLRAIKTAFGKDDAIPLRDLLLMSHREWHDNSAEDPKLNVYQYLEAWMLVHFLAYAKPAYQRMLNNYIMLTKRRTYGVQALTKAFGSDFAAIEKAWKEYVVKLQPSPTFVCMENLRHLAFATALFKKHPEAVASIEALHEALLGESMLDAKIPLDQNSAVTLQDTAVIETWFHCPEDKSGKKNISYEFAPQSISGGGFRDIICRHHGNSILRAYWFRDPVSGYHNIDVVQEPARVVTRGSSGSR